MKMDTKSIDEIKELEHAHLNKYHRMISHTKIADERMIKNNTYFVTFLEAFGLLQKKAKVFDIGCGTGWLVEMFRRKGYEACGGDILPTEVMYERYPQGKFMFFDIFEPPKTCERYHFIFIRSLGPIEKLSKWSDLTLFSWIGDHLYEGGVFYFAHNSNGSGIADEDRCNQTNADIIGVLEKNIGTILYCNQLPNNITFVCKKGAPKVTTQKNNTYYSYILDLWNWTSKNPLTWLIQGMPVLFLPSDDIGIIIDNRDKLRFIDYLLLLRNYPVKTMKYVIKGIVRPK